MSPPELHAEFIVHSSEIDSGSGSGSGPGKVASVVVFEPASEGISLAAIRSFYEHFVKDILEADCTTGDVLNIVKRITKNENGGAGLSYCQLVGSRTAASSADIPHSSSSSEVGPATVFISHAWKYNFYQFLLALEVRFKGQPLVRLWIDLFCQNQHEELTSDDWITKFEQHIVRINNTVMIVFPWENPNPFTRLAQSTRYSYRYYTSYTYFSTFRAWCLLEVFYSIKNGVPFKVYLTEEQQRQFLASAKKDPDQAMLNFSRISTRQSTCWVLNDQLRIHSLIESSVGFEDMDKLVHEAIEQAFKPYDEFFHQHKQIERERSLYDAARNGDREKVVQFLDEGTTINCRIQNDVTC